MEEWQPWSDAEATGIHLPGIMALPAEVGINDRPFDWAIDTPDIDQSDLSFGNKA